MIWLTAIENPEISLRRLEHENIKKKKKEIKTEMSAYGKFPHIPHSWCGQYLLRAHCA